MDTLERNARSSLMARIRTSGTRPELTLRTELRRRGIAFATNDKHLPGTPDIALLSGRIAVFVHGCFWHRHPHCKYAYTPKTRCAFWTRKFAANRARDSRCRRVLRRSGWRTMVIWECEVESGTFIARLDRLLGWRRSTHRTHASRKARNSRGRSSKSRGASNATKSKVRSN